MIAAVAVKPSVAGRPCDPPTLTERSMTDGEKVATFVARSKGPACSRCIASATGLEETAVVAGLGLLSTQVRVMVDDSSCMECRQVGAIFAVR